MYNNNPDNKRDRLTLNISNPLKDDNNYRAMAVAFLSQNKKPIAETAVVFYLDGTLLGEKETDENGNATIELTDLKPGTKPMIIAQQKGGMARAVRTINIPGEKKEKEKLRSLSDSERAKIQTVFARLQEYTVGTNREAKKITKWLEKLPSNLKLDILKCLAQMDTDIAAQKISDIADLDTYNRMTDYAKETGLIIPLDEQTLAAYNDRLQVLAKEIKDEQKVDAIDDWVGNTLEVTECEFFMHIIASRSVEKAVEILKELASKKDKDQKTQLAKARGLIPFKKFRRR